MKEEVNSSYNNFNYQSVVPKFGMLMFQAVNFTFQTNLAAYSRFKNRSFFIIIFKSLGVFFIKLSII